MDFDKTSFTADDFADAPSENFESPRSRDQVLSSFASMGSPEGIAWLLQQHPLMIVRELARASDREVLGAASERIGEALKGTPSLTGLLALAMVMSSAVEVMIASLKERGEYQEGTDQVLRLLQQMLVAGCAIGAQEAAAKREE